MHVTDLSDDMIVQISEHLPYIDKFALYSSCKKYSHIIKLDFTETIKKELRPILNNFTEEFLDAVFVSGAVISGSFIMYCILGEFLDGSKYNDIDVFDPYPNQGITYYDQGYDMNITLDNATLFSHSLLKIGATYTNRQPPIGDISCIRDFTFNEQAIQQIVVNCDVIQFIDTTFDFDICKSFYDGNRLHVKSWDKLFRRKEEVDGKISFKFIMSYCGDRPEIVFQEKYFDSRAEKYRDRGFDVTVNIPPKEEILRRYDEYAVGVDYYARSHYDE